LDELERLAEVGGESGQRQRGGKQDLLSADKSSPAFSYSGRAAGMGGMMGGARTPAKGSAGAGSVLLRQGGGIGAGLSDSDEQKLVNVRQVGTKTFFRKDNRWVDAEVQPDDDAKAETIEQFSDKFFELARSQSATQNQYLTFDEAITVNLDGKIYRIEKAKH
jgi:hypothetical protein